MAATTKKTPRRPAGSRTRAAGLAAATVAGLLATSVVASNSGGGSAGTTIAARAGDAPASYPAANASPIQGDRGDPLLNDQKNRFHVPAPAEINPKIKLPSDILALPVPPLTQGQLRSTWSSSDSALVSVYERSAAQVEGYIVAVRNENTPAGESSNCHRGLELHDFHIFMADAPISDPTKAKAEAVVVEMTPRWRAIHPTWQDTTVTGGGPGPIQKLVNKTRVRVTGWLMLDEEHLSVVGTQRGTVWELHPVTMVETQSAHGAWTQL
jgi:hypothetical protein